MWWKKPYVNRRDWILDNLGALSLSPEQVVVLLMIDFYNEQNKAIDLEEFAQACSMELAEVDTIIHSLVQSQYLSIHPHKDRIGFSIDGLFEEGVIYEYVDQDIFEVFETEFGRLLSQNELMTLNKWLAHYSQEEILEALRSALIYQKASMPYIEAILVNNRKEGKHESE